MRGVVKLAGLAEVEDVTLGGFLDDVERSGNLDVGGTVEGVGQGCEKLLARGGGELPTAF